MCCSYNPAKSNISSHLSMVGRSLDSYMSSYDNFLVIGDLNSEISEMAMSEFCETYNLQNLVKDPTCYKNPSKPTCIDLILTNFPKSFQHTQTIETGLSDFHKLTLTVLKTHFPRLKPNIVNYRDYKGFVNDYFRSELLQEINSSDSDLINFKDLQYTLQRALDKHAPLKKRYVRANQQNFMDKELNQAIMVRSKLRNKYLKSKSETDKQSYNKQRNHCVKLLRLKKQKYYECLDISKITDNKTFWKTISPLFSNKSYSTNSRITLLENGEVLSEETKVADTFNEFFSNVVKELKIENDDNLLTDDIEETDPVLKAIKKYKNHPSILRIKSSFKHPKVFSFKYFNVEDVKREINNLNSKKATPKGDIPVKILKWNSDIIAPALTECYNQNIKNSTFPNELKNADISPVFKKKDRHDKSNYRPVSILPLLSKPFERILYEQIDSHTKDILSKYQRGF